MNKKILNISNIFPHYNLSKWGTFINQIPNFYIGFDSKDSRGIKQINVKENFSASKQIFFFRLINIYLFKKHLIYQFLVIPRILFSDYDKVIFLGDSKVISTWISLIICKIRNKETVLWTHGIYGNETKLKLFFRKSFYQLADYIIVYERKGKIGLINRGFNKNKIHVIFNSLNYDKQKEILNYIENKSFSINYFNNNSIPYIISIGRLTKRKKIDLLIKVIKELNSIVPTCNLLIIGEGEQKQTLEKSVSLKDQYIHFYGECYDEKILAQLLYNAALTVIPGDIGLTAIHSLSFGTPVITHNNFNIQGPEHEAIEAGISGDFYDYMDLESLKSKIKFWLENKRDKRENIKNCRKNIDKYYNPDYQVKVMKTIIEGGIPLI